MIIVIFFLWRAMGKRNISFRKVKRLAAFFALTLTMSLGFVIASMALVVSASQPEAKAYQEPTTVQNTSTPTAEPSPTFTPIPTQTLAPTSNVAPTGTPTETATATAVTLSYGPDDFPPDINPLTGLPVSDPTRLERRPIAVKITNYPRYVRPQSGLSFADIVYEYYLERGITRFIALYYGDDAEKTGPIRSGRFFDEHIFTMYQSIFVFGNADKRVMDHFVELGRSVVNHFVLEQPVDTKRSCRTDLYVPLCRDRQIVSYNNMFANTAAMSEFISMRGTDNSRQDLDGMLFSDQAPSSGAPGTSIDLDYSAIIHNRWLFNPDTGKYLRFAETHDDIASDGREVAPLFDASTGQPVSADNVVVLFVPHEYFVNTLTTEIVKIHLVGEGPALLFRDGFAYPATWRRPEEQGVLGLRSPDGETLAFRPGVTFFQVVGETTAFRQSEGAWQFEFAIP